MIKQDGELQSQGYSFVDLRLPEEVAKYEPAIRSLFKECYTLDLAAELWRWAYLCNPCGYPFVSLALYEEQLVGHYAAIPQEYVLGGRSLPMILSMTTMVRHAHRAAGLFPVLARRVYAAAAAAGIRGVLGFPNALSISGFRKRLEWSIEDKFQLGALNIVSRHARMHLQGSKLYAISYSDMAARVCLETGEAVRWNVRHMDQLRWRLKKPGCFYSCLDTPKGRAIVKDYGDALDIVWAENLSQDIVKLLAEYAQQLGRRKLWCYGSRQLLDTFGAEHLRPYHFGFRMFDEPSPQFGLDLIMSDVF